MASGHRSLFDTNVNLFSQGAESKVARYELNQAQISANDVRPRLL
jgi:hypothetical protein